MIDIPILGTIARFRAFERRNTFPVLDISEEDMLHAIGQLVSGMQVAD